MLIMTAQLKRNILLSAIASAIVILIVSISLRPIYKELNEKISYETAIFLDKVNENVGLNISYKKLSPSLLFGARIYDIQIIDDFSKSEILFVKRARLNYKILSLLKGNQEAFFENLELNKIKLSYDMYMNSELTDKIQNFIKTSSLFNRDDDTILLPFDINLKNLNVEFRSKDFNIDAILRKINLQNDSFRQRLLVTAKGIINFEPLNDRINFGGNIKTNIGLNANIYPDIENTVIQLSVSELSNADYSISPFQLIGRYKQDVLSFSLKQNVEDADVSFLYDLNKHLLSARIEAVKLNPFNIVRIKNKKNPILDFSKSNFSGLLNVSFDFDSKNLLYTGDLNLSLIAPAISKGIRTNAIFSGNKEFVDIKTFSFESSYFKGNFQGNFNISKFQPQGVFVLEEVNLINGNKFQTEIYFDPLEKGFVFIIPQLEFGNQIFSAIQGEMVPNSNSVDFSLNVYDYTHQESEKPGEISLIGSVLLESNKFAQMQLSFDNFSLDAILDTVFFLLPKKDDESASQMEDSVNPYIMTTEMYVSTNFSTLSYNVPYLVIANTQKDREFAFLSFDGNESTINVTQLNVLYAGQTLQAELNADFSPDYKDIIFSTTMTANAIPYEFSGVLINYNNLTVTGNYGLNLTASFEKKDSVYGTFQIDNFPFSLNSYFLTFSVDSNFKYVNDSDWNFNFSRFEVFESSENLKMNPHVVLSGKIDSYGAMFETVSYSDNVSILNGTGSLMWLNTDSIIESAAMNLELSSFLTDEKYILKANVSNPNKKAFADKDFLTNLFFTAQASISSMPSSHFFTNQNRDNTIDVDISALGTLDNPGITVDLSKSSILYDDKVANLSGRVILEDGLATTSDIHLQYGGNEIYNTVISFNLKNFSGKMAGTYKGVFEDDDVDATFAVDLEPDNETVSNKSWTFITTKIPKNYSLNFRIPSINSVFWGKFEDVIGKISKKDNRYDLSLGQDNFLSGYYLDTHECYLKLQKPFPVNLTAKGFVSLQNCNVVISNIEIDADKIAKYVAIPEFTLYKGKVYGDLIFDGLLQDPEISGTLIAENIEFASPAYCEERISTPLLIIEATKNVIKFDKTIFNSTETEKVVECDVKLTLDRWRFDSLNININSLPEKYLKAHTKIDFMEFVADASINLKIDLQGDTVEINGKINAENAEGIFSPFSGQTMIENVDDIQTKLNLSIMIGHRSQVFVPNKRSPIMRALVAPQTEIVLNIDTMQNIFDVKGDLVLRGGEVSYGNRNFYLREGRLLMNETVDSFDPTITVRAETRERDEDGNPIRIFLSAQNQHFSNFIPVFSSSPAKSEQEILEILALSISGTVDTDNLLPQIIALGSEMVVQMTLFKQMENSLRDFFNFDIFSLRTSILQNAMNQYLNISSGSSQLTAGNFFDNSTVYIGKYFGNALYWDFLGHFSYNKNKVNDETTIDGLEFQPEMGFEMVSPFANFRWSLAPEIGSEHRLWVPYTSISVSWKLEL